MLKKTPAQYKKEYPFLREVDSLALQNVQFHLERAYYNFFQKPSMGFPKFKSKHRSRDSYTTQVLNGNIRLERDELRLPKLGKVRIKQHKKIPGGYCLKSVTVSREKSGKYYASLRYTYSCDENQTTELCVEKAKILGIDYAMSGMIVLSDGENMYYPGYFRMAENKLAKEQRKLSHCQKGSRNYKKQKKRVALRYEKIKNQRKDYIHKTTKRLADEYDAIGVEDIDMRAMSQCLHFEKSVMDNSFGMFREILKYKLEDRKKKFVKINRFYPSSKKCCVCGKVKKELKLSERVYQCECGNVMDRDKNAAINIREEAKRILNI